MSTGFSRLRGDMAAGLFGLFTAIATIISPVPASATPAIDTTGASFITFLGFGEPNSATFGQTFTVLGPETQLNSFSLRFDDQLNTDVVDFAAYIYAWNGTMATGAQLYASAGLSSSNNGGAGGMEQFDFTTGGLQLTNLQQYVLFASAALFFDGEAGTSEWEISAADAYGDGSFVYLNNGNDFSQLFSTPWSNLGTTLALNDMWFTASFSEPTDNGGNNGNGGTGGGTAVPEPASLALFVIGLAGLAFARRRTLFTER